MLRKISILTLLSMTVGATAYAQQPNSEQKAPGEKTVRRMMLELPFAGSYIGVQTKEITKENVSQYNLRDVRGVAVEKVSEDSPAAQADLQTGDVILKLNGEEITSVRKLTRLISEIAPDHQAQLTISRGGTEREITVTVAKREMPNFRQNGFRFENMAPFPGFPKPPIAPNRPLPPFGNDNKDFFVFRSVAGGRQIGVSAVPLTKQLGEYFGVADGKGLLINSVRENSPAAKAGLKAGDVIVEVEGKQVGETFDLLRIVNEKKDGDVMLTIVRDKNRQTFRVMPETPKGANLPLGNIEESGD